MRNGFRVELEAAGFSVWWDREIHGGEDFSAKIEQEITAAKTVVVLWSAASQQSKWVRDEAAFARDANKLIPLKVDETEPPFGFRQVQAINFQGWKGDPTSSAFGNLLASLRHFITSASTVPVQPTLARARTRRVSKWWWLVASVAAVAILAGIVLLMGQRLAPGLALTSTDQSADLASGRVLIGDFELVTDDAKAARFAKGLIDTIEHEFARTVGLEAVGHADAKQANAPVGTEFVVRGTIDSTDGKLAVNTDIVHVRDGVVLWSTRHERDAAESHWLQERVALELTDIIGFTLRARRFANGDTSSELLANLMRLYTNTDAAQSMEMSVRFRDAFPQYAISQAFCAVQHAYGSNNRPSEKPPEELLRLRTVTVDCAKAALAIDPTIGPGYVALAVVNDPSTNWAQREKLLLKSIEVQPGWHQSVGNYWYIAVKRGAHPSRASRIRSAPVG